MRSWNQIPAIDVLNYLQASARSKIKMAAHQCARFSSDLIITNERILMKMIKLEIIFWVQERSINFISDRPKGIECFVYFDFIASQDKIDEGNPENVL